MMAASLAHFVQTGKIEIGRCDVELGDLVLEAINRVLPLCVLRRQLLVTDISDEGLLVNVDVRLATQALERLFTNVAKLSAGEATIVVTTRMHGGRSVVTVTSSTLPDASFEALGLGYVAQLCELHGGVLLAAPGQLRFMLPHVE